MLSGRSEAPPKQLVGAVLKKASCYKRKCCFFSRKTVFSGETGFLGVEVLWGTMKEISGFYPRISHD